MSTRLSNKSFFLGFLCSALSVTPCLTAQSFLPAANFAGNAADFSTTIAQGSSFVVVGSSLGPATPVTVSTFPLSNTVSGTSVTITSGLAKLNCPLTYTSQDEVKAILPSNTPVGLANITVAYNGQTGSNSSSTVTVTVVASSVGIFTTTGTGRGTGNFTAGGTPITSANSAEPGETITAQATGLGPIGTPDNVLPTTFPNFPNVQVWVGSQLAQLVSDARSATTAGIDQISFAVPTGITGCNVPVTILSGGNLSNTATLPVSASGGACSDSGPTPPTSVLTKATGGQPVKVAVIAIGPKGIGSSGGTQAVAERLSAALHTRVSEADAAKLIRAYASRNQRGIGIAMAKYARQWKALDARAKASISAQLGQTQEGAAALFEIFTNEGSAATIEVAQFPPAGACVVVPQSFPPHQVFAIGRSGTGLDAGASLSLTGAASSLILPQSFRYKGQYHAAFGSSITGPNVPLGSYTISGTGGADVGAFSATITVGSHLAISNKSALNAVDPAQPFTVTWTGGVAGNYILVAGYTPSAYANNQFLSQAFFYCAEDGGKGSLTIPSYLLTAMNAASNAQGVLLISPHPLSNQIAISGLDLAYFADGSSDSANVTWSVAAAPASPVLISPANAATGVTTTPALAWSASPGATSYVVSLGTSLSPSQVATVSGTTYSPSSLSANTTYYWNVVATNATGSATSATFSFTTEAVVTGGSQTITFGPIGNQTLGTVLVLLTATASSGLPVNFTSNSPTVCTVTGIIVALLGTGTCSITASQPGNSTFAAAPSVTQTFTISATTTGPQPLQLITVAPCRIMDTRNPTGPLGGPFITGGTTRTIPIPSSPCGIPVNASAYSLNFTVVPRGALAYLSVWAAGQPQPVVSTLNSLDGSTIANAAIVPAGAAGAIDAYANNDTDLIVDINGYFAPPVANQQANSLQFYPLPPCRVLDTRNPTGTFGGPSITGGSSRSFPIPSSSCGVPATAAAYAFNVTVVPQGALAYLTAWPTGQPQPVVSTLNSFDGTILANAAIVPAGMNGSASFYASNTTDLVVDINGYFALPGPGGLNFYPVTPCRLVDTRNPSGPFGGPTMSGGTTRVFPLSQGSCGLPAIPGEAYSLNMTVVPQGVLSYLSTWPAGGAQPVVSTLNAFKSQIVANAAIVPAGGAGAIDVYVTNTTDVVIDTNGYFGQ
jgi:uncharacterized protein (TIGR03437 family)